MARKSTQTETAPNNGARRGSDADFDALKDDVAALKSDLSKLISDVGDIAKARSDQQLEKGKELADSAIEKFSDVRLTVQDRVKTYPMASLGAAFGAGVLISLLRRR